MPTTSLKMRYNFLLPSRLRTNSVSYWQRKFATFSQVRELVIFYLLVIIYDQAKLVINRNCAERSVEVQVVKNNPEEGGLVGSDEVVGCVLSVH